MPVIKKMLYGPAQIATGPTTVYTTPASTKAVIRHIHVMNPSGVAVSFTLSIGADGVTTRILGPGLSVAATSDLDRFGEWTIEAGTIVTVSASSNNVLVITIGGEERVNG
jgi:hypothetical protein